MGTTNPPVAWEVLPSAEPLYTNDHYSLQWVGFGPGSGLYVGIVNTTTGNVVEVFASYAKARRVADTLASQRAD